MACTMKLLKRNKPFSSRGKFTHRISGWMLVHATMACTMKWKGNLLTGLVAGVTHTLAVACTMKWNEPFSSRGKYTHRISGWCDPHTGMHYEAE